MAELTPQQLETLQANIAANRHAFPPIAMGGIGKSQLALVASAFGGIAVAGAAPDQPLGITPEKIVGFDTVLPTFSASGLHPEGILPNVTTDEMVVLLKGSYLINLRLNAIVSTGAAYVFEIYVNDIATAMFTGQDLSNQSTFLSAVLLQPLTLAEGDRVSVYGESDGALQTFTMQDSMIFMNMIR